VELHDLHFSPNIARVIKPSKNEMGGACSADGDGKRRILGFLRKPEVKRPLGRPKHKWEDIGVDLQEVGWGSMDWIDLAQDRDRWRAIVSTVKNLRAP
jgi:hypothetical protein